jgi:hypothetical protein
MTLNDVIEYLRSQAAIHHKLHSHGSWAVCLERYAALLESQAQRDAYIASLFASRQGEGGPNL